MLVNEEIRGLNFKLKQIINLKSKDEFMALNAETPMYAVNKRRLVNLLIFTVLIIEKNNRRQ